MDDRPHKWQRLDRKILVDTKFLKVYEDTVKLPTGEVFDDYTVASLPSGVVIVATDLDGKLLTQYEYKYATDEVILNLPSGSMESGKSPAEMASIELLEETGYTAESFELVQTLNEYPSKLDHVIHIVRARNATKIQEAKHETTESIGPVRLLSSDLDDYGGIFNSTYTISALALTAPQFIKRVSL